MVLGTGPLCRPHRTNTNHLENDLISESQPLLNCKVKFSLDLIMRRTVNFHTHVYSSTTTSSAVYNTQLSRISFDNNSTEQLIYT